MRGSDDRTMIVGKHKTESLLRQAVVYLDCVLILEALNDLSHFILHPWQADGMGSITKMASIWPDGKNCRRVRRAKPTNGVLPLGDM